MMQGACYIALLGVGQRQYLFAFGIKYLHSYTDNEIKSIHFFWSYYFIILGIKSLQF